MRRRLTLETDVSDFAQHGDWLLAPRPFDAWDQRLERVEISGAADIVEIQASNSRCRAFAMRPGADRLRIAYDFAIADAPAPPWVWDVDDNRHTTAAPELAADAKRIVEGAPDERAAIRRLIDHAAEFFHYGHRDEALAAGCETVPTVCGLTRGSCVDINTFLLAAARSVEIRGQYVAGYWFHPDRRTTADMHCWLAFEPRLASGERRLVFWDLAHALKWAESLGATIEEGLNPAGGRRLAMSCGRGLRFETPRGAAEISHFSEPTRLAEGGATSRPDFTITLEEEDS